MILTRNKLNTVLQNWRISIPAELETELLNEYGKEVVTQDGCRLEYSEQDICEQLRKIVSPDANPRKEI